MSKLAALIEKLAVNKGAVTDPFDDDFFDREAYERRRLSEEEQVIDKAMREAKAKGAKAGLEREAAKTRTTTEFKERYWE